MKVCHANRYNFYQVLERVFYAQNIKPKVMELGVLRGENALNMHKALAPELLVLVDSWSMSAAEAYCPFPELPVWVDSLDKYAPYYGGSMHEQATYDRLFEECQGRFEGLPNIHFIRSDTAGALKRIQPETGVEKFELIYIDANHQYEYILHDLMTYQDMVADEGCMVLNDCCHSHLGTRQNLGVLEAVTSFIKRSNFVPVALTNTDWSDLILVRRGSMIEQLIDHVITNSDIAFVDVPHQLLPAARIVQGQQGINISFV